MSKSVDLTKVKAVKTVFHTPDANDLLKKGWVLLETASGNTDDGEPTLRFVLGFLEDAEER